jgi:hydroxyacylglutathione hydrolase
MKIAENLHFFPWNNPSTNNCNTYFIDGKKKILVDPGHYHLFDHVRDQLSQLSLTPEDMDMVIITHGHPDHMEGVKIFERISRLDVSLLLTGHGDMVSGRDAVAENFRMIEDSWFAYL